MTKKKKTWDKIEDAHIKPIKGWFTMVLKKLSFIENVTVANNNLYGL